MIRIPSFENIGATEDDGMRCVRSRTKHGCTSVGDHYYSYFETMKTGVPTSTCWNSHSASEIRMRIQPCEAE